MALTGRRILVTRSAERAGELVRALESRGAEVVLAPATRILDPPDPGALARVDLARFDWAVFTSAEAARRFASVARDVPPRLRLAAVGPATAEPLGPLGSPVLVPARRDAEGLAAAIAGESDLVGRRVLFPKADRARETLPRLLAAAGAEVVEVVAYRTVADPGASFDLRGVDLVVFFSPSAVQAFAESAPEEALRSIAAATIGPTTSAAVRALGGRVEVEAPEPSTAALVEAIARRFG